MVNSFTPTWFTTYLKTYSEAFTQGELAFITRQAPQPTYRAVLDLCCGNGRLALPLAALGYTVVGVERDGAMVADATARAIDHAQFIQADMRDLATVPGTFDVVLNMWHSFGYFDADTNTAILRQVVEKLNPHGRFILDIYNRAWFDQHQGVETLERDGRQITTTRSMQGDRLSVRIDYGADLTPEVFDWQLYTPEEICALAKQSGLRPLVRCAWADESRAITSSDARMQFVFEKVYTHPIAHG